MNVIIFGGGGQAKETIDLIEENLDANILGFIDNNTQEDKIFGYNYLGQDKDLNLIIKSHKATHFYVAIGDLNTRSRLYLLVKEKLKPLSIISKNAVVSKHSKLGEHVLIYPGVVVNADVSIGNDVLINTNASISHEVKIGNHINISPGVQIAGKVQIGDFSIVGLGASIKEKVKIAQNSFIGAGAVVTNDTQPNNTYIGIPAKVMQ